MSVREAARELLRLKDIHDAIEDADMGVRHIPARELADMRDDYRSNKAKAWQALRTALAANETVEVPRHSIVPVLRRWAECKDRYERVGSDWHNSMPANWPFDVQMTMGDVRAIVSAVVDDALAAAGLIVLERSHP